METEIKTEGEVIDTTNDTGEGEAGADVISIPKSEYDKTIQTLGSLKREIKDLKKSKDETPKETSKSNAKPDESNRAVERLEKVLLKTAGITHEDDVKLAKDTAKKWNMDVEDVLNDEDFMVKLTKQQNARANVEAVSGIRGNTGGSQAKNTPEYWIAKGVPPTANEVPDSSIRRKIARAMMNNKGNSKKFYND